MTHPPGSPGDGGGSGGTTGPGRTFADEVRALTNADAYTSLCDTFIAAQLRRGFGPDQLDRDGWPVTR